MAQLSVFGEKEDKLDLLQELDFSAPTASAYAGPPHMLFHAWQPSAWPAAPKTVDEQFIETLKRTFEDSILSEINNLIKRYQQVWPLLGRVENSLSAGFAVKPPAAGAPGLTMISPASAAA
jgi:hypothetical protein